MSTVSTAPAADHRAALDELRTALYRGRITDEQAAVMLSVLSVVTRAASDIAADWPFLPSRVEDFRDYIARAAVANCVRELARLSPPAVLGAGCASCAAVDDLVLFDRLTLCTSCRDAGDEPPARPLLSGWDAVDASTSA